MRARRDRRFKLGNFDPELLRHRVGKDADAVVDCLRETSFAEWTTHAISHLPEDTVGQGCLRRAADLRK
jgi:hypothetical protein